jgi:DNA invertase Pin-like site-specific DNA recombinase
MSTVCQDTSQHSPASHRNSGRAGTEAAEASRDDAALGAFFGRCGLLEVASVCVWSEKQATKGRPQLEKAIDALGTGDVLVVAEWDRATRSMMDGVHIIERIHARGAMIKVSTSPT